jgi:hypothetical protein
MLFHELTPPFFISIKLFLSAQKRLILNINSHYCILDKGLKSYGEAQLKIAEKLEELSKYMRERSNTPLK